MCIFLTRHINVILIWLSTELVHWRVKTKEPNWSKTVDADATSNATAIMRWQCLFVNDFLRMSARCTSGKVIRETNYFQTARKTGYSGGKNERAGFHKWFSLNGAIQAAQLITCNVFTEVIIMTNRLFVIS